MVTLFWLFAQPSVQLATQVTRHHQKQESVEAVHSDTSLLVGNLPWNVATDVCEDRLKRILHLKSNESHVTITMKPVTTRPRDRHKCHGGSAQVTFDSHKEAVRGMAGLIKDPELRVRWAIHKPTIVEQKPVLSDETIHRRKERAARYARKRQRIAANTDTIIAHIQQKSGVMDNVSLAGSLPVLDAPLLDWSVAPKEIDPTRGGGLCATARGERKRAAVEAFVHVVRCTLLSPYESKQTVADLGSGAGNLSLPLAWWLRHFQPQEEACRVLGVDLNERSLKRLVDRAAAVELNEEMIGAKQFDMLHLLRDNTLTETLSAVVSLHACGAATDLAIATAVRSQIPFAVSPCCIGKVNRNRQHGSLGDGMMPASAERSAAPEEITYPRSEWLQNIVDGDEYALLAAAADYAGSLSADDVQEAVRRRRSRTAKQIVELDRLQWAKEKGYAVRLMELPRIGPLYSKRELLLGAPAGSRAAKRMRQLPFTSS